MTAKKYGRSIAIETQEDMPRLVFEAMHRLFLNYTETVALLKVEKGVTLGKPIFAYIPPNGEDDGLTSLSWTAEALD